MSFGSFNKVINKVIIAVAIVGMAMPAIADTVRVNVTEYSSKTGPYFEKAAKAYEAAHPGTEISIEVTPWDVMLQKLTTDISGGANADLVIIGTRWLIDFVDQDLVVAMDNRMDAEFKNRFFPAFLSPSVLNGKTYGLPIAASARAMYYNKDLFKKAGISSAPSTWDEVKIASAKIAALGDGVYGFGLQGKEIETDVYFYYAFWSYGGKLLDDDGTSGLDSEAGYKAAALMKSMIDDGATQPGVTSYTREDVQNLFKQGKVGMMITAPFLSAQIREQAPDMNYGVAAIPRGPDGVRGTYGVTDSIVMFENSKNKDAAWSFLDFIFQDEWRSKFTSGEGFLPVNKAVAIEPSFANDDDLKVFASVLPDARFAPIIPGWEEIADITSSAVQKIYLGDADPETALNAAAKRINNILNK